MVKVVKPWACGVQEGWERPGEQHRALPAAPRLAGIAPRADRYALLVCVCV